MFADAGGRAGETVEKVRASFRRLLRTVAEHKVELGGQAGRLA